MEWQKPHNMAWSAFSSNVSSNQEEFQHKARLRCWITGRGLPRLDTFQECRDAMLDHRIAESSSSHLSQIELSCSENALGVWFRFKPGDSEAVVPIK